jgi:hypothetical protein
VKYFEIDPARPAARCERGGCLCGGAPVAVDESFLFISRDCVHFRLDCQTLAKAQAKVKRLAGEAKAAAGRKYLIIFDDTIPAPMLYCRYAAESHGIDMKIAAADAAHWRATSQAPYRPTPIAGDREEDMSANTSNAQGCLVLFALVPLAGVGAELVWKLM